MGRLEELQAEIDRDDERDRWAWAGLSHVEQRAERVDDDQLRLCASCGVPDRPKAAEAN